MGGAVQLKVFRVELYLAIQTALLILRLALLVEGEAEVVAAGGTFHHRVPALPFPAERTP